MAGKPHRRDRAVFIRISERELDIIEKAIKIKYGEVEGSKSRFARQAMLAVAKKIIEDYVRRRGASPPSSLGPQTNLRPR